MEEKYDLKVEKIENYLEGKRIGLCVTGGIAAIETPKIARHLRRYGADVRVYATQNALKFIGEASLEWATEKPVVSELSGLAEHICLEDLVLVAPATMNTINKIMLGIADNAVTSLIASALGNKTPVYIAPTMHKSLYDNPFFQENLKRASSYGIRIIEPRFSEGKAKIPHTRKIADEIIKYFRGENAP
jgi:phosphopantothenoylcysteine decarboxylase / phosphopantothenate---cysteine ligase